MSGAGGVIWKRVTASHFLFLAAEFLKYSILLDYISSRRILEKQHQTVMPRQRHPLLLALSASDSPCSTIVIRRPFRSPFAPDHGTARRRQSLFLLLLRPIIIGRTVLARRVSPFSPMRGHINFGRKRYFMHFFTQNNKICHKLFSTPNSSLSAFAFSLLKWNICLCGDIFYLFAICTLQKSRMRRCK